jgi:hypothetical protein
LECASLGFGPVVANEFLLLVHGLRSKWAVLYRGPLLWGLLLWGRRIFAIQQVSARG